MDTTHLLQHVSRFWDENILPTLTEFIRIPNESPHFDRDWAKTGHMERAVKLVTDWVAAQELPGATVAVLREGARTPLILVDVPGDRPEVILVYGHIDKQPPMTGWREGLGPWTPVLDGEGRFFGRGGADDGYAVFAAVAVAAALKAAGQPHATLRIVIECSEESGSPDLPHYLQAHGDRIGDPSLVICLDSGCGNYAQLWSTTSLRGLVAGSIKVEVTSEGVHSGIAGGIVPSPARIQRLLLERLEDAATGTLRPPELSVAVPAARRAQAEAVAAVLGAEVFRAFPFLKGVQPERSDPAALLLRNAWESTLTLTAQEGLPPLAEGGNVLLPSLTLRYSLRIPPTLAVAEASAAVRRVLEADPPHGARVTVTAGGQPGWEAPPVAPWLERALAGSSREFFGREACAIGLGGSIPFMHMMGERFPKAQFLITGVLGPHSNAHGPNEFLHVPYAKKLTCCLVRVVTGHFGHVAG